MRRLCNNIPELIVDSLSKIDKDLMQHGERVAYAFMEKMKSNSDFSYKEVCRLTWTILFHDIGLFHNKGKDAENDASYSHSEYGYLFLKEFSPYPEYAVIVRYHHAPLYIIDRKKDISEELKPVVKLLIRLDEEDLKNQRICGNEKEDGSDINIERDEMHTRLMDRLSRVETSETEREAMLHTLISAIDFRSRYTAIHCAIVVKISDKIGQLIGLSAEDRKKLHVGMLLHDLGKIAIPLKILESTEKLKKEDWEIMKSHVTITEELLKGRVDEEVIQIAVRHHETMDGKGYPRKLTGDVLTAPQKIAAIADIISALSEERSYKKAFSMEKILTILKMMRDHGKISGPILEVVEQHQEKIFSIARIESQNAVRVYDNMMIEYNRSRKKDLKSKSCVYKGGGKAWYW